MKPKDILRSDSDQFLRFENVENKRSNRADLHAFIVMSELDKSGRNVVSASGHDEIWFSFDVETILDALTPETALDLVRCGVRLDTTCDCFCMFV